MPLVYNVQQEDMRGTNTDLKKSCLFPKLDAVAFALYKVNAVGTSLKIEVSNMVPRILHCPPPQFANPGY